MNNNNDYEYEYEIICTLISNPKKFNECNLESKHFQNTFYKNIYPLMEKEFKEKGFIDVYEIEKKHIGFVKFALDCADHYITSAHLQYYIERVEEKYKLLKINEVVNECNLGNMSFYDMNSKIVEINNEFIKRSDNKNKLSEDEIYNLITRKQENLSFSVFTKMSNKIGFIKNGIHVISARPSVGKSAFAINLMNDLSRKYKCIYLNMEMNEQKIYQRMVSCESGVPIEQFNQLDRNKSIIIKDAIRRINKRNYQIMNGSKSVKSIKSIISKESKEEHTILFIDYIGYVTNGKNQNDRERIGNVVRELQLMTKDYDVTMFMLAQINRDGNDEPTMINLKDSGEIEQSAETVLILHNPNKDLNEEQPIYTVLVPKNRNGRQGKMDILFDKKCQRFIEIENSEVR